MKASRTAGSFAADTEVDRDFKRLGAEPRRRIALRILRDQKMLADLYDHFLIQRSLDEPGQNLAWESYVRQSGSGR